MKRITIKTMKLLGSSLPILIFLLWGFSSAQGIPQHLIDQAKRMLRSNQSFNDIKQDENQKLPSFFEAIDDDEIESIKNLISSETVQDQNLDPDKYYVGPGDIFGVYIWGDIEKVYSLSTDAEGKIIVPLTGIVEINGLTLSQARERLIREISKLYDKKVNIAITLRNIRQFKVYVTGEIKHPGAYLTNGMVRASDIIEFAGGIKKFGRRRNIEITNKLYEKRYLDLVTYLHTQDIAKNPYIREGDRIFIGPRNEYISVTGYVNYPNIYDLCQDDHLDDILAASGGFARGAQKDKIIITRFVDDNDSLETFEISFEQASSFKIMPDDRIFVCGLQDYREHLEVQILGEVQYPGSYPIRRDKTRLVDVIAMAGGLTNEAFLKASKIVRKFYPNVGEREFERVKAMPTLTLTPLERSYLKTKLVEENGIVSIDFEKLFYNGSDIYNIIVRDKDEITIARQSLSIKVSGAVVSPGLIGFKLDADYNYYIKQAGGFNTRARKRSIMVIKGGTEIMLKSEEVEKLEAGDAIWIPEKEYKDKVQIIKDILSIMGSTATVVLSALTIYNFQK